MKIETIEIFGFVSAFRALRLPFKGKNKSDSIFGNIKIIHKNDEITKNMDYISCGADIWIGKNDLKLIQNLIKRGDEHAKVVRGIIVSCSITAPRYLWQEIDTYRIGTERLCSESTMHCEARGLSGKELQKVKAELKEGHEQERIQEFSYQALRRIYVQRRNHRLPEWKEFCEWIDSLPLANELITIGLK